MKSEVKKHKAPEPKHPVKGTGFFQEGVKSQAPKPKFHGGPEFDAYALTVKDILDEHEKAIRAGEAPKEKDVFLKLTRKRSDRDTLTVLYIRPKSIESVALDVAGYSVLNGNRYLTVTETPERIFKMLTVARTAGEKDAHQSKKD